MKSGARGFLGAKSGSCSEKNDFLGVRRSSIRARCQRVDASRGVKKRILRTTSTTTKRNFFLEIFVCTAGTDTLLFRHRAPQMPVSHPATARNSSAGSARHSPGTELTEPIRRAELYFNPEPDKNPILKVFPPRPIILKDLPEIVLL